MGMMDATQDQQGGYNGTVSVGDQQVAVRNGSAIVNGEPYFVSNDGSVVADKQRMAVGYIENGQFMPMTEEYANVLRQKGIAGQ